MSSLQTAGTAAVRQENNDILFFFPVKLGGFEEIDKCLGIKICLCEETHEYEWGHHVSLFSSVYKLGHMCSCMLTRARTHTNREDLICHPV